MEIRYRNACNIVKNNCPNRDDKVMVYFSSNYYNRRYHNLPFNFILLVSATFEKNDLFRERGVTVICLALDNNLAARILVDLNIHINCLVGIQDGCVDGGNYECINSISFISRLFPILRYPTTFITNHIKPSKKKFTKASITLREREHNIDITVLSAHNYNLSKTYDLSYSDPIEHSHSIPNSFSSCNIIRRSIWQHIDLHDLIFTTESEAYENYCHRFKNKIVQISRKGTLEKKVSTIIDAIQSRNAKRIAFMPFMKGNYKHFLEVAERELANNISLSFYHLKRNDFKDLK